MLTRDQIKLLEQIKMLYDLKTFDDSDDEWESDFNDWMEEKLEELTNELREDDDEE